MPEHKMETIGGIRYRPEHTDRAERSSGAPLHNAVSEPEPAKTLGTGAAKRGAKRGTGGADGD